MKTFKEFMVGRTLGSIHTVGNVREDGFILRYGSRSSLVTREKTFSIMKSQNPKLYKRVVKLYPEELI